MFRDEFRLLKGALAMFNLIATENLKELQAQLNTLSQDELAEALIQKNETGKTLLLAAIDKGSIPFIRAILSVGASLSVTDNQGKGPLLLAVEKGSMPIVEELLALDIPLANEQATMAIRFAEDAATKGNDEFAKIAALLRTRKAWQNNAFSFRFNRVAHLINQSFTSVEPATGFDKLLFIGATGAGKSTLLNYLNSARYKISTDDAGKNFAELINGKEVAEIGHGMTSQTLHPQVIKVNREGVNFAYCDLAGLFDSRGDEERICAASSVQILSRLPGKIKGIVVVLDIPCFLASRGAHFKKTAVALSHMINNDPKLIDSIYFVITKQPPGANITAEGIIKNYVKPLLTDLDKRLLSHGLDTEDLQLRFMMQQIEKKDNRERILIPNIADEGQSQKALEKCFSQLAAKDSTLFNFLSHDGSQKCFIDVLTTIAEGFIERRYQLDHRLQKLITRSLEDRKGIDARIADLEKEIKTRKDQLNVAFDPDSIDKEIQTKKMRIAANQSIINNRTNEIKEWNESIADLNKRVNRYDTHEMIYVDTLNETIPFNARVHRVYYQSKYALDRIEWNYRTNGILTYHLEKPKPLNYTFVDSRDGTLCSAYEADNDARQGVYQALFSSTDVITSITIKFFTQKRDWYAAIINNYRQSIKDYKDRNAAAEQEVKRLCDENEVLRNEATERESDKIKSEAQIQITKMRLQAEIEKRTNWYDEARKELNAIDNLTKQLKEDQRCKEKEIEVNGKLFEVIYKITKILNVTSNVIVNYWKIYEENYKEKAETKLSKELQLQKYNFQQISDQNIDAAPSNLLLFNSLINTPMEVDAKPQSQNQQQNSQNPQSPQNPSVVKKNVIFTISQ